MRSKATVAPALSLMMLFAMVIAASTAIGQDGDEGQHQHSPAVIETLTRQCAEGIGHDSFCDCAIEAVNIHLPPQHASLHSVSPAGSGEETLQIFELHDDVPRHVKDELDDAILACRDEFFEIEDPDTDSVGYEHSRTVLRALRKACRSGIGNDRFCRCAIEMVEAHLPPQYASFILYPGQKKPAFVLHEDLPGHIEDKLEEAILACRDEYVDLDQFGGPQ